MPDDHLKVFLTDPHERGGGQVRYVTNLAQELMRLGHHVTIGCKPGSLLAQRAREIGCSVVDQFSYRGGLRPRAWLGDIVRTRRYILDAKPDIVHVSGSQDHWVSAIANRLAGRRACIVRTRHNTYTVKDSYPNRVLNRKWTTFQIVVCDVVRKTLERQRTFDGRRMVSIHNGVDTVLYAPNTDERARARAEFGYTDEHVVCGIAARLVEAKGHALLIKAVRPLTRDFPQLRVLILGQGALEAALKKQVHDAGLDEIVNFAGFRDDMPYCTQAFDIGVLPSIDCDTSSFSLKEEMAAEKAVIASDYGGLKEILSDGVEGFITPTGTVEPIGSGLRRMLKDPELRVKMGKAGRLRVLRDFSIEVFVERTVTAYRRALAIHRGAVVKILHLDEQCGWRGGEQQASWLLQGQVARGHRVGIVGRAGQPFLAHAHGGATIDRHDIPMRGEWDLYSAWRIAGIVRREAIDILHAHSSHAHTMAILARRFAGRGKVIAHRRVSFPPRRDFVNRWKYDQPDRIVCVSGKVREVMAAAGIPAAKLALVYSAVDLQRLQVAAAERASLDVAPDAPLLFNAGALVGHKDQSTLIRAAAIVRTERENLRVLIAGEGALRAQVEAEIAGLRLAECVTLLGHRDDVPALVRAADVYVSSSWSEGLGTSVLEALAAGTPVVAAEAGGIPEMVRPGETGWLCPNRDPEALAAAILECLAQPDRAEAQAAAGTALVEEKFTTDAMVDGNLKVYEEVLSS